MSTVIRHHPSPVAREASDEATCVGKLEVSWHEKRTSKSVPNIACSTPPYVAFRGWRGYPQCDRNNKKQNNKTSNIPLNLATWNVRTLLDKNDSDRPQRRTALIADKLARYNIDIAAISETRFAGEGELCCKRDTGYTFFWSERGTNERLSLAN